MGSFFDAALSFPTVLFTPLLIVVIGVYPNLVFRVSDGAVTNIASLVSGG